MEVDEDNDKVESLGVRNFLAARIQEINSLSQQIYSTGVPTSKGLAFQHVPKHMRRRAVSHNPKRLPKRLQGIHLNQVEKSSGAVNKKPKTPSRRHRRRPSNLLKDYNRRQRTNKWMETHIWHAKRFHMEKKWGYQISISPTDKGYRAGYKAAKSYCAMRDISYYSCLEIQGPFALISSTISSAFAPINANPLSLSSEMYKHGKREGVLYFYKSFAYPFGFIGKVRFHWKTNQSSLFLWVHPAQKEEVLQELCLEFELLKKLNFSKEIDENELMQIDTASDETLKSKESFEGVDTIEDLKLEPKRLLDRPKWINYTTKVILTDLEGVFNRLRFYGPLSTPTLKEVLKVLSPIKLTENTNNSSNWWINYYEGQRSKFLSKQCELLNNLHNFHQVPCNSIIPLTVNDPRILIPQQRKPMNEIVSTPQTDYAQWGEILDEYQDISGDSPLFDEDMRTLVVNEKMSQQEFDKLRSQLLIPGSKIDLGHEENQVPILLIHRSSNNDNADNGFHATGWDLVLPSGWAMPFWVAFVYRSVRSIGLRESQHFEFESGSNISLNEEGFLPPDSLSGQISSEKEASALQEKYFKYPPAKRSNLIKLACPFPFSIDWKVILNYYDNSHNEFYVLRDYKIIEKWREAVRKSKTSNQEPILFPENVKPDQCLIGIRLTIFGQGTIESGAVICIPTEEDIQSLKNERSPFVEEPIHDDTSARNARLELTGSKIKLKTFLATKRQKLRKREAKGETVDLKPFSSDHLKVINDKIQNLWLGNSDHVLKAMSRTPIGLIVFGHETYSIGKCSGVGYCALKGLELWLSSSANCDWNPQRLVLVRSCRNSVVYRFATIQICSQ